MTVPNTVKPYPATASVEAWKAAKTDSIRDKWNTELSQALRVAQRQYRLIKFDMLDLAQMKHAKGEFKTGTAFDTANRRAHDHYSTVVVPAINALADAKKKATAAGNNLVISKPAKAKAKEIATALDPTIRVLKAIHLDDFEAERQRRMKA